MTKPKRVNRRRYIKASTSYFELERLSKECDDTANDIFELVGQLTELDEVHEFLSDEELDTIADAAEILQDTCRELKYLAQK